MRNRKTYKQFDVWDRKYRREFEGRSWDLVIQCLDLWKG